MARRWPHQHRVLLLYLAFAADAASGEPQGVPGGLDSENFPASAVRVEGGGEVPRHAQQPKFKQIREEDIPDGTPIKTINDGDLLDLTEGKYDKKAKYSKAVTKMFDSVMTDDPEKISAALSSGIDINIQGPDGYTPLFQAVFSHRVNAVKLLLAKGADTTKGNDRGFHPLDAGAFSGCDHCVHLLLKQRGVNPHRVHADGYNALHRAIWGNDPGHTEIVRMLLEAGLSPTAQAFVPDKGYLEPINMVDENDATKALLENWIDKEARAAKRAQANAPCVDDETDCAAWAEAGECSANPEFMHVSCKRSCKVCVGKKEKQKGKVGLDDLQRAFGKKDEL